MLTDQELPLVEAPHVSQAAAANQTRETAMTTPRHLSLVHMHGMSTLKRMSNLDMRVREAAYVSANWLEYLTNQTVAEFAASDAKELQDSAWRTPAPDGTLSPRRLSLVFLSRGKTELGGPELLSAASHLAFDVPFGCTECSARSCRFAFLAGPDAEQFLKIRRDALPEASRRMELVPPAEGIGEISVCISWCVRMAAQTVLNSRVSRVSMPAQHGSVFDVAEGLVAAIAEVCAGNSVPATPGLTASRNAPSPDCFCAHQIKVYSNFQALLLPEPAIALSDHIQSTGSFLDFSHKYVRVCSRFFPLDHFSTHFGVLLHEKGKTGPTQAWLTSLREAEPSEIYGLRPPAGAYEQQLGLHVLSATAESLPLGTSVSCYSLGCHPGSRLDVRNGCCVWQVKRAVAPLEKWLTRESFVLPCTRESAHPRAVEMRLPLFEMMEHAIAACAKIFGQSPPTKKIKEDLPVASMQATANDRFLTTAFGLGLHVDAVRVGDVQDRLASVSERSDGLTRLLLMAIAKVGAAASVTAAFGWFVDAVPRLEKSLAEAQEELHVARERDARQSDPASVPQAEARVDQKALLRAANAVKLEMAASGLLMARPVKEDEVEKLMTLVCKAVGRKKKELSLGVLNECKSAHGACDQESFSDRVLAVVGAIAGGLNIRILLQVADQGRLIEADKAVGLEALFSAAEVPGLLLLSGSTLQFFQKS